MLPCAISYLTGMKKEPKTKDTVNRSSQLCTDALLINFGKSSQYVGKKPSSWTSPKRIVRFRLIPVSIISVGEFIQSGWHLAFRPKLFNWCTMNDNISQRSHQIQRKLNLNLVIDFSQVTGLPSPDVPRHFISKNEPDYLSPWTFYPSVANLRIGWVVSGPK